MGWKKYYRGKFDPIWISDFREYVEKALPLHGDRVALAMDVPGQGFLQFTFNEIAEKARAVGTFLVEKLGLKKGDRVAIISESRPEWGTIYFGTGGAGLTTVPVDVFLSSEEMVFPLSHSETRVVFVSPAQYDKFVAIRSKLKNIRAVVHISKDIPQKVESVENFTIWQVYEEGTKLVDEGSDAFYRYPINPEEDVASLVYTSGTTGISKGVMLTHKNIIEDANLILEAVPVRPTDRVVSVLPLHHTYECTAGLVAILYAGAYIEYAPSLKSRVLIATFRKVRPNKFLAVPLLLERFYKGMWKALRKRGFFPYIFLRLLFFLSAFLGKLGVKAGKFLLKPVLSRVGLDNIEFVVSGGGPISPELIKSYETVGIMILQGYGLTETSPVVAAETPRYRRIGSVGKPLPGIEMKIHEPNPDGVGELWVKGPVVMKGYYKNEEATRKTITEDGWLRTGDLARMDSDGFVYITGRAKNLIVTKGGKNIYPEELELAILQSPYILETVVFGIEDPDKGEIPYAVVVPDFEALQTLAKERGFDLTPEKVEEIIGNEIKKYTAHMADYKRIRDFEIWETELPKTSTKKVKRYVFGKNFVPKKRRGGK